MFTLFMTLAIVVIIAVIAGAVVFFHITGEDPYPTSQESIKNTTTPYVEGLGVSNLMMICPHCQTKGKVYTKAITKKTGVSGGKATAALLTGGLSLLAFGLSKKEDMTKAHCGNCSSTWTF